MEISSEYEDLLEKRMLIKHSELNLFKSLIILLWYKVERSKEPPSFGSQSASSTKVVCLSGLNLLTWKNQSAARTFL